jgi:hypothetical protein
VFINTKAVEAFPTVKSFKIRNEMKGNKTEKNFCKSEKEGTPKWAGPCARRRVG